MNHRRQGKQLITNRHTATPHPFLTHHHHRNNNTGLCRDWIAAREKKNWKLPTSRRKNKKAEKTNEDKAEGKNKMKKKGIRMTKCEKVRRRKDKWRT